MGGIVTLSIPYHALGMIRINGMEAEIGGPSFRSYQNRQDNLAQDQVVSQDCEAATVLFCTGLLDGYIEARQKANANKYRGDGRRDVIGLPVDVKGSMMRARGSPRDYRLILRPQERRERWVYVLALVERLEPPVTVHLAGWTRDSHLPPVDSGRVACARTKCRS